MRTLDQHYWRAGELARGPFTVHLLPDDLPGWHHTGLRVIELAAGEHVDCPTHTHEAAVLPLAGRDVIVECSEGTYELAGRPDVFAGPSDFVYVPRDSRLRVRAGAEPARVAVASAPCERRLPARYVAAEDVPVELRGAGPCSRQVHNFCAADVFDADKLIAVEVLTPGGNWSSYPPHKHDEFIPGEECELEEIYYFEIAAGPCGPGMAYQRVYGHPKADIDELAEVRTGDLVCMPYGWHGPSMAVPGYDLYYLNVMAGPGPERAWLIRDDPAHGWIRETWVDAEIDPRLPFGATTRTSG